MLQCLFMIKLVYDKTFEGRATFRFLDVADGNV